MELKPKNGHIISFILVSSEDRTVTRGVADPLMNLLILFSIFLRVLDISCKYFTLPGTGETRSNSLKSRMNVFFRDSRIEVRTKL